MKTVFKSLIIVFIVVFTGCRNDLVEILDIYTISYDANGADSGTIPSEQNKFEGQDVILAGNYGNLEQDGHTFNGWNTDPNSSGSSYNVGSVYTEDQDITLFAQWEVIPTYIISYSANGADTGYIPDKQIKSHGIDITLAINDGNLERSGYHLLGWNSSSDLTGKKYLLGDNYSDDAELLLYAHWTQSPVYTVSYDGNGSVGEVVDPNLYLESDDVTIYDATALSFHNYVFKSWNTKADNEGTSYYPNQTIKMPPNNLELYAEWAPPIILSYNGNGASSGSVPNDFIGFEGQHTTVANSGDIEKSLYTFISWNTLVDGTGISLSPGDNIILFEDTQLFAQWGKNVVSPSFLDVSQITENSITLIWDDLSDSETNYIIEKSIGNSSDFEIIEVLSSDSTLWTDNNIIGSDKYSYRVKAINDYSESEYATREVITIPNDPDNLLPNAIEGDNLEIKWNDNSSSETSFLIEREDYGVGNWTSIAEVPKDSICYTDNNLVGDTSYRYRVKAKNKNGESKYATSSELTTKPYQYFPICSLGPENIDAYDALYKTPDETYLLFYRLSDGEYCYQYNGDTGLQHYRFDDASILSLNQIIDSKGNLHLIYKAFKGVDETQLIHAIFDGINWERETLDTDIGNSYHPRPIAYIDNEDTLYIAYSDINSDSYPSIVKKIVLVGSFENWDSYTLRDNDDSTSQGFFLQDQENTVHYFYHHENLTSNGNDAFVDAKYTGVEWDERILNNWIGGDSYSGGAGILDNNGLMYILMDGSTNLNTYDGTTFTYAIDYVPQNDSSLQFIKDKTGNIILTSKAPDSFGRGLLWFADVSNEGYNGYEFMYSYDVQSYWNIYLPGVSDDGTFFAHLIYDNKLTILRDVR